MKLWLKLTLLFTSAQLVTTIAIGVGVIFVVRGAVEDMVERESRTMVAAIADTVEVARSAGRASASAVPPAVRSHILDRRIGETGFYFLLNSRGDYLVHPKPDVEGQNWAGEQAFIDYILANRNGSSEERFIRYVSPKTGQWKQVYFSTVPGTDWIINSSAWEHEMYAPIRTISATVAVILVAALLLTSLLTVVASRRIGGTLGGLATALERVGTGDLTARVQEDGWSRETALAARSLNEAVVTNIRSAVVHIQHSSKESAGIQEELSSSTIETSSAVNQIAANIASIRERIGHLDETIGGSLDSINVITSSIRGVDERIGEQTAMIEESRASIEEMTSYVGTVSGITSGRREATERLSRDSAEAASFLTEAHRAFTAGVVEQIDSIRKAAGAIQAIAAQTNLLAMNAAIEAAHAGDAGRGFAVVASGIRDLASEASSSSGTISNTINEVVESIQKTKEAIDQAATHFSEVVDESAGTAEALAEIQNHMTHLESGGSEILTATDHLQETALAIKESSGSIRQQADSVLESANEIRDISAENAAGVNEMNQGVEEINLSMQNLSELSTRLSGVIDQLREGAATFRTEEGGDA